jgi:hypothetical protein
VRDRLEVDLVEGDEFVGEKVEGPARASFWGITTGEFDEACFSVAVEFALVFAVGFAAMNRREPSFTVVFACLVRGADTATDVLTDFGICEPVVSLEENSRPHVVLSLAFTSRNEPLKRSTFFVREINNVLLPAHSSTYAVRDDKLASTNVKLH